MHGRAITLGTGTILNALATTTGSAFVIDAETAVSVELDDSGEVRGSIAEALGVDAYLVECCVELAIEASDDGEGGTVETESDLPMAAGLKSSSAAANATVLATSSALGRSVGPGPSADISCLDACRMDIRVAHEVGVAVTEVFDDVATSVVGGVAVTDNTGNGLIARSEVDWDMLMQTPPERTHSAGADMSRCENVTPTADLVADPTFEGRYAETMIANGLAFSTALDFPTDPAVEAMSIADGVSLSGAGPSVVAVGDRTDFEHVKELWDTREGKTRLTTTRTDGTRIRRQTRP